MGGGHNFIKYISNQNWHKHGPTEPQHIGIPLTVLQFLTSIHNLFQTFPKQSPQHFHERFLSRYVTHFSAYTCISNFIQQHMIIMKITNNTWLDRISRDVILFKQKYAAQRILLKNVGAVNWDRTEKYKHTPWDLRNTSSSFNHDRISKSHKLSTQTKMWDNEKICPDEEKMN